MTRICLSKSWPNLLLSASGVSLMCIKCLDTEYDLGIEIFNLTLKILVKVNATSDILILHAFVMLGWNVEELGLGEREAIRHSSCVLSSVSNSGVRY